jgi:alkylated DNA repair dioxygenase AlkB
MANYTQDGLFNCPAHSPRGALELTLDQKACPQIPGSVRLFEQCLNKSDSNTTLQALLSNLDWQQPYIRMHGREIAIPRKQVWMGDPDTAYRYSGKLFIPENWDPTVLSVKARVESMSGHQYNSVLCNLYRDGQDSVAWHADDEPELDPTVPIASISFGATRRFDLKPKNGEKMRIPIQLEDAMLLVMSPEVQMYWLHQIPKTKKVHAPRVNLTFRQVKTH